MTGFAETRPERRLFTALPGEWTLARVLPGIGRMTGIARFRQVDPAVLGYREDGWLTLDGGQSLKVFREYHYRLEDGQIRICFAEPGPPRTFHVLRLAADATTTSDVHLCGEDTYTGTYKFTDENRFSVEMRVRGPRKDYTSHTVYDRVR